jgi:hypothetical protein
MVAELGVEQPDYSHVSFQAPAQTADNTGPSVNPTVNFNQMGPQMQAQLQPVMNPDSPAIQVNPELLHSADSAGLMAQTNTGGGILADCMGAMENLAHDCMDARGNLPEQAPAVAPAPDPVPEVQHTWTPPSPSMMS